MAALARNPQVFVKISMLPFVCAGWENEGSEARRIVSQIVSETLALFGKERCMLGSNFPVDATPENSLAGVISSLRELTGGGDDLEWRTAARFYRL